jgi:hypothetical protein
MSLTSHDKFFGFIHSFRLNPNSHIMKPHVMCTIPYPRLVNEPTFKNVFDNWNRADTGVMITTGIIGAFISRRLTLRNSMLGSGIEKRSEFGRLLNMSFVFGFFFGLRNSHYRL